MANLARLCFEEMLAPDYALPDPRRAYDAPPGLAGIVHDFTLPTILAAYRRGLYPLAHVAPLKWWSPPQRSLLLFDEMHMAKRLRQGRIFLDYLRNDRMATAVAPLSPRARPGAHASMPLTWPQVKTGLDPARYTIRTVPKLLAASKAWADYDEAERPLAEAIKKLGRS